MVTNSFDLKGKGYWFLNVYRIYEKHIRGRLMYIVCKNATFLFVMIIVVLCVSGSYANAWRNDTANVKKNIAYGADELQKLDIYIPDGGGGLNLPVHIFVHGGAWRKGDKRRYEDHALFYNVNNIIFVSINYRLSPKDIHPAQIEDCARAVKWVIDNIGSYGGDVNNINISGHSAGAHLVALLGTDHKYLAKYDIPLSKLKTVIPVDTASFDFTTPLTGLGSRVVSGIIDETFGVSDYKLRAASPLFHVDGNNATRFMMFVTSKRQDAVSQTKAFHNALVKAGTRSSMYVIEGLSHREMNKGMSDPKSPIAKSILKAILN